MNIPMVDLKVQYRNYKKDFDSAVIGVMESSFFIMGPEVSEFENEVAASLGAKHAFGLASGTDALLIALLALGVGPGDEVLVPAFTFIATSEAVSRVGAKPVFVDVCSDTFNIDVSDAARKVSAKTKAIIPVHLYGQSADMDGIMALAKQHKLYVVEDCAQAQGALWKGRKVGTLGDIGCFSFFPSKNLGAYGDGGMVVTNEDSLTDRIRALRNHGSFERYYHVIHGFNSRLDSMQAAVLRVKLKHLDEWNEMRRAAAVRYTQALKSTSYIPPVEDPSVSIHVYHQYTIKVPAKRNELQAFLASKGVASMIYYPLSLHKQEVYKDLGYKSGDFPVSESLEPQVLSLPMFPELTKEQTDYVIDALLDFQKQNF